MRSVLVGSDFMYRQDGKLVPIEINTNVGMDYALRVGTLEETFDFETYLIPFLEAHSIDTIVAEATFAGCVFPLMRKRHPEINCVTVENYEALQEYPDSDNVLIVRESFSYEAIIDTYCADKSRFLRAIKGQDYAPKFAVGKDNEGNIQTYGTVSVDDNDYMPNVIVKCHHPNYDHHEYPKVLRFTDTQLQEFINSEAFEAGHHIMPYYFNENKSLTDENQMHIIRNWSLFVDVNDSLEVLGLGNYQKVGKSLDKTEIAKSWNPDGSSSLEDGGHKEFIVGDWGIRQQGDVILDKGDLVWMADGSWKKVEDLTEEEDIKLLDVPVGEGVDIHLHTGDYNTTLEEWNAGSSFSSTGVGNYKLRKSEGYVTRVTVNFTDGTDWVDTEYSSYPTIDPEDGTVVFKRMGDFQVGDKVILIQIRVDDEDPKPQFVVHEVSSISSTHIFTTGYGLTVNGSHLFMTRTDADVEGAYISIGVEHNRCVCSGKPNVPCVSAGFQCPNNYGTCVCGGTKD